MSDPPQHHAAPTDERTNKRLTLTTRDRTEVARGHATPHVPHAIGMQRDQFRARRRPWSYGLATMGPRPTTRRDGRRAHEEGGHRHSMFWQQTLRWLARASDLRA